VPKSVTVISHPLVQHNLTRLRDKRTGPQEFRRVLSEVAALMLGVDVTRKKLTIFIISAVYASVAGSYLALFNGHITPDVAGFLRSIELVAMVVLGGMGSILGSLVGAVLLVVLPQALTIFHEYEQSLLGLILIVFMIFLRRGIVPSVAAIFAGWRK